MKIDTTYLKRCIMALDGAYHSLEKYSVEDAFTIDTISSESL